MPDDHQIRVIDFTYKKEMLRPVVYRLPRAGESPPWALIPLLYSLTFLGFVVALFILRRRLEM